MADKPVADRTETATPKRRGEARNKGQVLKSNEVNIAFGMLVSSVVLMMWAPGAFRDIGDFSRTIFSHPADYELSAATLPAHVRQGLAFLGLILLPMMGAVFAAGLVSNLLQVGFLLTTQPLMPNLQAINPMNGIKRIVSVRGMVELVKSLIKVAIVLAVAWFTLRSNLDQIIMTADSPLSESLRLAGSLFVKLTVRIVMVFVVIAFLDWMYQRFEYEKSLKMTKEEVKQENKDTEGNPQIKGKIRQIQIQTARKRMMSDVKTADVVVTNPTHLAVALSYKSGEMDAPTVVAKGARLIAQRIKEIARENGVPVVEDKPLARALFKSVAVGQPVPSSLFRAVAEILAYVYKLKGRR